MKLVCTDLDRTLLPNGEQPESALARPILWHLLSTYEISLAYVSGRNLSRVLDAISEYNLQIPDLIVADVGTSLYTPCDGLWTPSSEWDSLVRSDWNGYDTDDVKALLKDIDGLQDQEADRQSRYKRSYYFSGSLDESRLIGTMTTRLVDHGIKASLVVSHDPEKATGLLDVVPQSATKREAVAYLQSMFDIPSEEVMFSGDSGNDVSAICAAQPGVLVANADNPTRAAVQKELLESLQHANTFIAQGDLDVTGFDSLNGNYSAGIVEGLMHFRPQWRVHLQDAEWLEAALAGQSPPVAFMGRSSA